MKQTTEWFIPVEDFYAALDAEYAFDTAKDQCERVFKEVTEALNGNGKIVSASFLEFDSNNPTHANAVYSIEVEGFEGDLEEDLF